MELWPAQNYSQYPETTRPEIINIFLNLFNCTEEDSKIQKKLSIGKDSGETQVSPDSKCIEGTGSCILINKKVDNAASLLGIEHTSALFQSTDGEWYFFFWGDKVVYERIENEGGFNKNIDSVNEYLFKHGMNNNPKKPYTSSVYIEGNFDKSMKAAEDLYNDYLLKKDESKSIPNPDYDLLLTNCTQVTMRIAGQGTLPDGNSLSQRMKDSDVSVSVLPNTNMKNMQEMFGNSATNAGGSK